MKKLNLNDFGALGDGTGTTIRAWLAGESHDLGKGWSTLTDIQTAYPRARSLDNTIDEVAFTRTFDEVMASGGGQIFISEGIFVFTKDVAVNLPLTENTTLEVLGQGPNTILKRAEGVINRNAQFMIHFLINGVNAELLRFSNFKIDGGGTGNPLEEGADPYLWQHCTSLRVTAKGKGTLKFCHFENLWLTNPIADQLAAVFNTTHVSNPVCTFSHIYGDNRQRTRADIIFYPGSEQVIINDCSVPTIECEFGRTVPPDSTRRVMLSNIHCDILDLSNEPNQNLKVMANNVVCGKFWFAFAGGSFVNCDLTMTEQARINYTEPTHFLLTTFRLQVNEEKKQGSGYSNL